jgi:hypothetical protein
MIIDIDATVGRLQAALAAINGAYTPVLCGYSAAKTSAVARYAGLIADAYASGLIDDDEMAGEIVEIVTMTSRIAMGLPRWSADEKGKAGLAMVKVILADIKSGLLYVGAPVPPVLADPEPSGVA